MKCNYCGHENDETEKFCSNCGMKLGEAPPAPEPGQIRCETCGFLNPPGADICGGCGQSIRTPKAVPEAAYASGTCPACGFDENPPDAQFCINCGVRLSRAPQPSVPGAKLVLSDMTEIPLDSREILLGRKDFLQATPPKEAKYISREHFKILHEDDAYFILDEGSSNGTTVNGEEIKGKEKKKLHDDDEIVLADTVTVRFREHT